MLFARIGDLEDSISAVSGTNASRINADAVRTQRERAHELGSAIWSGRLDELKAARDLAQMERELEALADQ